MKTREQLVTEFGVLDNDKSRWIWVKANQGEENLPKVDLDNDDTCICIEMDDGETEYLQFDHYIGWGDGVEYLLEAMGINAESV